MTFVIPRKREYWHDRKPPNPEVDWGHELSDGLAEFVLPETAHLETFGSSAFIRPFDEGLGFTSESAGSGHIVAERRIVSGINHSTITSVFKSAAGSVNNATLYSERNTGNAIHKLVFGIGDTTKLSFVFRNDNGDLINTEDLVPIDLDRGTSFGAFVIDGQSSRRIYCDGELAENTTTYNNNMSGSDRATIGADFSDNAVYYPEGILATGLYTRALSTEELEALDLNPYQILKPRRSYTVLPEEAAGAAFQADLTSGSFSVSPQDIVVEAASERELTTSSFSFTAQDIAYVIEFKASLSPEIKKP